MSSSVTQTQVDSLIAAIARGVLTVKDGENSVTYRSVDDMSKALAALRAELATGENPNRSSPRYQLADFRDD